MSQIDDLKNYFFLKGETLSTEQILELMATGVRGVAYPTTDPDEEPEPVETHAEGELWMVNPDDLGSTFTHFGGLTPTDKVGSKYTFENKFIYVDGAWVWKKRLMDQPTVPAFTVDDISREKPWLTPAVGVSYSANELLALNAILYFYSTVSTVNLSVLEKGHTTNHNRIGVKIVAGTTIYIYQGTDTGIKYYQQYLNNTGTYVIIVINWTLLADLPSGQYVFVGDARIKVTTVADDKYLKDTAIQHFAKAAISNIADYLYYERKTLVPKTFSATQRVLLADKVNTENVEVRAKLYLDTPRTHTLFIGFNNSSVANRIQIGYIASSNAVVMYAETIGFSTKLIDGSLLPASGLIELAIRYENGEIFGFCNGQRFNARDYFPSKVWTDLNLIEARPTISTINFSMQDIDINRNITLGANLTGSQVVYYKTGLAEGDGSYNDWCFVRTPPGYNPYRANKYPFVICNHGNGSTYDGTPQETTYTPRTQFGVDLTNGGLYMNPASPYYKQYSNETIERLLAAGYVVCGTQNYADALYGNDNCRQAVVDFYEHMKEKWHVEDKCFMIGVSNGAMTSLNATYLLGIDQVKALVLQYPLACLFRHYKNQSAHQVAIRTAYGIGSSPTDADLHAAFNNHDPEYADTIEISGVRYKTDGLPPVKIWWSATDTVTIGSANAVPLADLIQRSNGKVEITQVDAGGGPIEHGDYQHFDAAAIVTWFNKYL